jgi:hypothetical protein
MDTVGPLLSLLFFLAIVILLFWLGREIVCWYWKINDALDTLKSIEEKLTVQINIMARSQQKNP